MSDKTELDMEAERASFAAWYRAEFGYAPTEADLYGHAFSIWCTARRATIQPTAAEPVGEVVSCEDYGVTIRWAGIVPKVGAHLYTAPVAPADAVRDARNEERPTDISKRLRECANAVMLQVDRAKLMLTAADECERFYGGMVAWKETAQAKDRVNVEAYAHKIAAARIQALEEAAQICDAQADEPECPERAEYCAEAIRALKTTPTEGQP